MSRDAPATPPPSPARDLYDLMTGDEDARVCRDIPEAACQELPRNFFLHLAALIASKSGDLLASSKLVLPWLLSGLGAPPAITAMLVPVRESLALLPQLLIAGFMRAVAVRKWFWVAGSTVQGLAVLGMVGVAIAGLRGAAAGWSVLGLLVIFSLARGACSVAAKDVMGKTVSKARRGTLSGYAASASGAIAAAFALYLIFVGAPGAGGAVLLLAVAGLLWLLGALAFAGMAEEPGATEGGGNAINEALRGWHLVRSEPVLRRFIVTRGLLTSSALVAPFFVLLAQAHTGPAAFGLAVLLLASSAASAGSSVVWGRSADRSSRLVLAVAGALAALASVLAWLLANAGLPGDSAIYGFAGCYLLLGAAHSGVRLGRKTYLVDMAGQENRATYVALSNTLIGVVLLAVGGLSGLAAQWLGSEATVLLLAVLAVTGSVNALRLPEVQRD